jgi:hypothetical protein
MKVNPGQPTAQNLPIRQQAPMACVYCTVHPHHPGLGAVVQTVIGEHPDPNHLAYNDLAVRPAEWLNQASAGGPGVEPSIGEIQCRMVFPLRSRVISVLENCSI